MKLNIVIKDNLNTNEKSTLYNILNICDNDFFPSLSNRSSYEDKYFDNNIDGNDVTNYYNSIIGKNNIFILVYKELSKEIIAFAILNIQKNKLYLSVCCVLPAFRHNGIGKLLIDNAVKYFESNDYSVLYTRTWSTNIIQTHILEKFGFKLMPHAKERRDYNIESLYYCKYRRKDDIFV